MALPRLLQKLFQNDGAGPLLNEGILPKFVKKVNSTAPDETGNASVDVGVKTINGNAPDDAGNVAPDQTGCLPLEGGTLSGNLFVDGILYVNKGLGDSKRFQINRSSEDGTVYLELYHNSTTALSRIVLRSPSNTGSAGVVEIDANDGATYKKLSLWPNGTITWGGKPIPYITASSITATGGYIKWSNGVIEQWGYRSSSAGATITFPTAFSNKTYTFIRTSGGLTTSANYVHSYAGDGGSRTTTSIAVHGGDRGSTMSWYAIGK